ncbi:metallophosphoesterase [Tsukamurella sp. 8F]|uniref:metallophosphoesterase n=1 Tax=unclassified Tsukamurella TaxID=2633480 RepID=UPI0023B97B33|nr:MULTISPECIES: metallophosphoesterase [unclassified Tsukamurella]MDF0528945.1 metallophosphoesterase [Tsukamurella sp. 8J]MDF0589149.1 metallophosphoesterase [Tsukamurella sp. 8F]
MAATSRTLSPLVRAGAGLVGAGLGTVAYATLFERNAFTLREATLPILPPGSPTLRVLHISDLHMMPSQHLKQAWLGELATLDPDLVVNTGDNLSHPRAVPAVVQALGPLLGLPGLFVFGSNDYFGPTPKNPAKYFDKNHERQHGEPLPWQDLRAAFSERGWLDATHSHHRLTAGGVTIAVAGVDDPHIERDRYDTIAGPADQSVDLRLGLTHSPEPHVLDRFADDGYDLVMAGHTHGGQLCLPVYGAIITNCGLDRARVKGPSAWGSHMKLHVSAGLGTSPWAPFRTFCRPEASLLTLVGAPVKDKAAEVGPELALPSVRA